ncbi:MAG: iron transporter substrate-binding protein [Symbiobacteriaceae bacterium]|jgi:iron(III) transport system substrate-binding protein|nr:iron transporter substrate-binding protein [Symbiobacteriaceae bacterium]
MRIRKWMTGLLVAATLTAGCGGAPQGDKAPAAPKEEEKRLTFYTSFGADLHNPIAQAFEKETGIKVDVVTAGTGEMLNRIKAEAAAPQGDVMLGGGAESYEAYRDYFEAYKVKDDAAVPAAMKAPDNLWYGYNALPMVIAYNKNLVPAAEAPKGWKDLTDPKWKGKIAMADANKSGTSFVQVVTMLTLFGKEPGGQGWRTVEGVVKNSKVLGSSSLPPKGVNDGEYHLALTIESSVLKYATAGGPIAMIYPAEGTATIPDSASVIKGAQHPQNARKFMDFLFSKTGQELAAKLGLRPTRSDVAPPQGLQPLDQIKLVTLDMPWVATKRSEILSQWQDVMTK